MVTRKEVAEKAGVSVAAVSYVMNNKRGVSESTRKKVQDVIEELGYSPSYVARSLKTKKTNHLAVFINYLGDPFEAGLLLHIEQHAKSKGYYVFFHTFQSELEEQFHRLLQGRVDGVLLIGQSLKPRTLQYLEKAVLPVVSITKPAATQTNAVPYIDIDWESAMRKLIRHLRQQGHERIGFMAVPGEDHRNAIRKQAFIHVLQQEGLYCEPESFLTSDVKLEWANEAMDSLFAKGNPAGYTAFVATSDLMAIGMLNACNERQIPVPGSIAIASCENILMTLHTTPKITVLNYPRAAIAVKAVDMLINKMEGRKVGSAHVECELLVRGSTQL